MTHDQIRQRLTAAKDKPAPKGERAPPVFLSHPPRRNGDGNGKGKALMQRVAEAHVVPVLTSDETELVRLCFMRGPSALFETGYTTDEAMAFLRRPEVRARLDLLNQEYLHREESEIRTRFMVRRRLSERAIDAANMLSDALDGPVYERCGENLYRLSAAAPTETQVAVAQDILDRLGCRTFDRTQPIVDGGQLSVLLSQAAEQATVQLVEEEGKTPVERALSRERVRVAMEKLRGVLTVERARALASAGGPSDPG